MPKASGSVRKQERAVSLRSLIYLNCLDATNPGSKMSMVKYFYIYPRLGLKEFSAIHPPFAMSIMSGIVTVMGKLSGWDKLVNQFR